MDILDAKYWETRYLGNETGWDIGYANPAIVSFFEDEKTDLEVLIPGCGNAYEGEQLFGMGFQNLHLLDFAESSKTNLLKRLPSFPQQQFIVGDFFNHEGTYDIIVEQTFFCALDPSLRKEYVKKMHSLLKPGGRIVGVMFKVPMFEDHPPFGGNEQEYRELFEELFEIRQMVDSTKSIPARRESELFIELVRK